MSRAGEPAPPEERTIYVANFADDVTEDLLEELFVQTGPVVKVIVRDVKDTNARFALIEFEDEASVLFAIELMNGIKLFNKEIQVKPRNKTRQEELYRRKRAEIEERVRASAGGGGGDRRRSYDNRRDDGRRDDRRDSGRDYHRERSPHRDYDRSNSRNSNRSGGSSTCRDSYPRHRNEYSLPPPPPPPPLMGDSSWRTNPHQPVFRNPQNLLPHQLFVNVMQQQQHQRGFNMPPPPPPPPMPPQYHHQNTPRRQDHYRGADRHAANHYNGGGRDNRRSGGGGGRY